MSVSLMSSEMRLSPHEVHTFSLVLTTPTIEIKQKLSVSISVDILGNKCSNFCSFYFSKAFSFFK